MNKDIFGRSWEEIQAMQQRKDVSRKINVSSPGGPKPPTDDDRAMLTKYGSIEALEEAGFHGIVDRLKGEK